MAEIHQSMGWLILVILWAGSFMAFAFLGFSLPNLARLDIGISHPRVLVEAGLGVIFLAAGIALWILSQP